jgi:hypothetical protein
MEFQGAGRGVFAVKSLFARSVHYILKNPTYHNIRLE